MLEPLRYTLRLLTDIGLEPPPGKDTAETLLSASKFEGLNGRENPLTMAARLQPNPAESNIQAEIVY